MGNKDKQLELPQEEELAIALAETDYVLMKTYQYDLPQYPVLPPSQDLIEWDVPKHTRLFKIDRIAYDKDEDNLAKLSNVYNALSAVGGSVIIIIDSDENGIDFYIGTKTAEEKDIHVAFKTLGKALSGNFPGCAISNMVKRKIERAVDNIFLYRDENSTEEYRAISSVSGISSLRELAGNKGKLEFTQGIEKLIDSMRGETYSVILLADPVPQRQIDTIKKGYEQMYSKLVPFASAELSLGYTSGKTLTNSITQGTSDTISESLTVSQSHSHTSASSKASSNSVGFAFLASASYSSSKTTTESDTETETKSKMAGSSQTKSFSLGLSDAISEGESRGLQIRTEEKSITSLIQKIDAQLQRLSECGDLGMWNCSAYFIADDLQTSKTAASTYQALIRGKNSGLEAIAINTWTRNGSDAICQNYDNLSYYLKKLCHPEISIGEQLPIVTPTSLISSAELTIQAGLPQKSIPGVAVAHYASFGREIQSQDAGKGSTINLGHVFHMGTTESGTVSIDKQSLTAHTFVTGSTGAGKSNAVYQLLSELGDRQIPFLVIEPAKGEYKHVFGSRDDVNVYGTNPNKTQMLKINPFKFPEDIHVLEHIDRLIEIFNVCWPMYAAMPAVLKDAVERAYLIAGWDFETSSNRYSPPIYPTFSDVLAQLYAVINESDYSAELKGNYTGALITRVKSLTTGLDGQIFVSDEIGNHTLFDSNTIVDLSRVTSSEIKALIMGLLVMRLQEHRMSEGGMNRPLRHVTVLEEAHHLLKRTSTEQFSESSNLLGKSVEMLSQSMAEMRTYGEGFIIADQSPNMLDMSVIRNTNTKIILRLPDISDRELCGRAASLDDEQIIELAKLPTGVAAVYQNDWIEPVLCKIDYFPVDGTEYHFTPSKNIDHTNQLKRSLIRCFLAHCAKDKVNFSRDDMVSRVIKSNLSASAKQIIIDSLVSKATEIPDVCAAISALFDTRKLFRSAHTAANIDQWNKMILSALKFDWGELGNVYQILTLQCIIKQKSIEDDQLIPVYNKWVGALRGDLPL